MCLSGSPTQPYTAAMKPLVSTRPSGSVTNNGNTSVLHHVNNSNRNSAKKQAPQMVQHNYTDHSCDLDTTMKPNVVKPKGGVAFPFPIKLHDMLEQIRLDKTDLAEIVSWQPHGRSFCVHKPRAFEKEVLSKFFAQHKYASFQRQLNLYGFLRITKGPDRGSYYHELFLRNRRFLCEGIKRMKVKGTGARIASNPDAEPDFYKMESVGLEEPVSRKFSQVPMISVPQVDRVSAVERVPAVERIPAVERNIENLLTSLRRQAPPIERWTPPLRRLTPAIRLAHVNRESLERLVLLNISSEIFQQPSSLPIQRIVVCPAVIQGSIPYYQSALNNDTLRPHTFIPDNYFIEEGSTLPSHAYYTRL